MKEYEYLDSLKREVAGYRKKCLDHMKLTYHIEMSAQAIRHASWAYTRHFGQVLKEHLDLVWPQPIGSGYTDTFHHSHFIRGTLASIFCPEEPLLEQEQPGPNLAQTADNELQRKETQVLVYQALAHLIPEPKDPASKEAKPNEYKPSPTWKERISEDLKYIRTRLDEIYGRLSPEDKAVDKGPNRRSKLPHQKQKSNPD